MDNSDKCLSLTLGEIGQSLDGFVDHVVTGVENGYPVDVQFAMCREVIKAMGHE